MTGKRILVTGLIVVGTPPSQVSHDQKSLDAFRAGAGVFVGTFLMGNNWD